MSSPSQDSQDNPRYEFDHDTRHPPPLYPPPYPHLAYARLAASNARARAVTSSRTGPTSFSNILNPFDGDWNAAYLSGAARNPEGLHNMTQNGATLDGPEATGGVFYPSPPTQQLPDSSRAFEPFMTRATLDMLTGFDSVYSTRTDPLPGPTGSSAPASSTLNFPRPSYLEGSHYLARLEQQARQRALTQRESHGSNGVHVAANGHNGTHHPGGRGGGAGGKTSSSGNPSYLGITRDVVERTPAHEHDDDAAVDPLPTRWSAAKEDRAGALEVLGDGLEVKYAGPRNASERDHEACSIRADKPMPLQCGMYYFEVTILSNRKHAE